MHWTQYANLAALGVGAVIIYTIAYCIYNVFFHPLRSYPGPKLWASCFVPAAIQSLKGRLPYAIKELHDQYGEVVRVLPNMLSYDSDQAWEDIYGHIKGRHTKTFEKDYSFYGPTPSGAPNIIMAGEADHRRLRKLQSHAFSEKALVEQEPFLIKYLNTFIKGLRDQVNGPAKGVVPISMWYNFTTFDLIGDLAFAHPFGCTESGKLHPWIAITFEYIKMMEFMRLTRIFPTIEKLLALFIPQSLKDVRKNHAKWSADRAEARVAMKTDRKDFMSYLLRETGDKGMSKDEINEGALILVLAVSLMNFLHQTATVLTGMTYFMLKRPETYDTLRNEIRTSFESEEDMTVNSLGKLKYLNACIEEGLRMFPPAPTAMPRVAPKGGDTVCGRYVPQGTVVGVTAWAAHRSSRMWKDPDSYLPERWIDSEFDSDHKKASQAFSYGPRNCLGKNLAWAEMRLIMAHLLWNFDLELVKEDQDWMDHNKIFILWEKAELHVKLTARVK
ncbi:cytochrome P450 [Lepidopterella palustris CBS 459.81]|uniref:Cytochrome P450 n=1 Tax=Lepidopterella palustris CBS 459.81 TaxID=1314670 RepID=A0A8E2JEQ7_9PEZI|nr:cytochrome P450 [Lepidopterella palustris CBS 459.81]